jgi:hypothetical protein
MGFDAETCAVANYMHAQSADIALGVDESVFVLVSAYSVVLSAVYLFFVIIFGKKVLGLFMPDFKDDKDAEGAEDAEGEAAEDAAIDPSKYVLKPDVGDKVFFDIVIGGDAVLAVLYSDNGSVEFDGIEYTQSGPVQGTVTGEDVQWGVAFYDANDYIFDTIDFSY